MEKGSAGLCVQGAMEGSCDQDPVSVRVNVRKAAQGQMQKGPACRMKALGFICR